MEASVCRDGMASELRFGWLPPTCATHPATWLYQSYNIYAQSLVLVCRSIQAQQSSLFVSLSV